MNGDCDGNSHHADRKLGQDHDDVLILNFGRSVRLLLPDRDPRAFFLTTFAAFETVCPCRSAGLRPFQGIFQQCKPRSHRGSSRERENTRASSRTSKSGPIARDADARFRENSITSIGAKLDAGVQRRANGSSLPVPGMSGCRKHHAERQWGRSALHWAFKLYLRKAAPVTASVRVTDEALMPCRCAAAHARS